MTNRYWHIAATVVSGLALGACAPNNSTPAGNSGGAGGHGVSASGGAGTGGAGTGGAGTGGAVTIGSGGASASGGAPATGGAGNAATGGNASGGSSTGGGAGGSGQGGGMGGTVGRDGGADSGSGGGSVGGAGGGTDMSSVASALNSSAGFKLVAPCGPLNMSTLRSCDHNPRSNCGSGLVTFLRTDKTIGGTKGTFYNVRLRFRGIIEANQYTGGTSNHKGFYTGGTVSNANGMDGGPQYNQYVLDVSSPKATFHLNHIDQDQREMYRMGKAGSSGLHHFGFIIDYIETIRVEGGATVSLYMLDNDCLFGRNCKPPADDNGRCELQTVAGIPADVQQPLDGNFIWIDVDGVTLAP
jgi:hypothetical protein